MAYSEKNVQRETERLVEKKRAAQKRISADDVTLTIVLSNYPSFKQGSDYICLCVWNTTRKIVGDYLARHFKDDDGETKQLRFPGFDHLQRAYLVSEQGDSVVVPLEQLSAAQLDHIADRIEKEGKAKLRHAKEVRKYRQDHFGAPLRAA